MLVSIHDERGCGGIRSLSERLASRLMKLESYVNNKVMEVEGQQQQNIVELGNIKGTQSAAQQNLIASIEEELDKKSQKIAELQNHPNQTLEDIKK